jgi:LmbE family N-acetylglucosaminyl deacetylase
MTVMAIGAHPDDIELGCGGSLRRYADSGERVVMLVLTDGARGTSGFPSRRREQQDAASVIGAELVWGDLDDGDLSHGPTLIDRIGAVIDDVDPALVMTHALDDSHQDHTATARATLAATRELAGVLHYETPSTLTFNPQVFCDVDGFVDAKLDALRCHLSQMVGAKRIDAEALTAQVRFRGFQGRLREAEAFEVTRTLLVPTPAPRGADVRAARATLERR